MYECRLRQVPGSKFLIPDLQLVRLQSLQSYQEKAADSWMKFTTRTVKVHVCSLSLELLKLDLFKSAPLTGLGAS